ncbi:dihydroxyacetone kinase [Coniosporium apollinis CBS 100218]|uniref:Dihydroxyacetone kinase n=1 Tax=Coniosporium apollinis (strain CBS 100218) TaxID=1168221 RepID=R7YQG6_CONA1|nr:dihydroxyacetone kinase [Coniosporium apollinis CBS 100218]EON64132.1 dihydroxyacetone kinase [Coniosporium apollinis CBS 100218]
MSAKHFINDPTHLVQTALHSITLTNPAVALDASNKIIYQRPTSTSNNGSTVSLISGGGSGHEPSFASLVGPGFLTASVAGTIFASPSAEQVRRAILQRVDGAKGVLVIVMNYTGDVLNFGMGVEKAKAGGLETEMLVVGDDVGVGRKQGGKVGRRGIAGTVLVLKVAGALAQSGASLKEVYDVARLTADNIVSIGSSLSHVHVPGRSVAEPSEEDLKENEVEIGMGIHNEAGSERKTIELPELVKTMLAYMLDPSDKDRGFLEVSSDDDTVLLVNNLGGVSVLEMGGITNEVVDQLEKDYQIKPVRILSGTYMTSLNGLGFSISLLKVKDTGLGSGKSMLELLDAPAEVTGWSAAIPTKTWQEKPSATMDKAGDTEEAKPSNLQIDPDLAKTALTSGLNRVIAAESDITNYDTIVGDGDCGIGLRRGAESILKLLEKSKATDDAGIFLYKITQSVENSMDGTSGAIYAIFLNALAHGLRTQSPSSPAPVTVEIWANALNSSLEALTNYTPAKPGDRTLMDALYPFVEKLAETKDVHAAAEAAQEGAKGTKGMKASLGRTVYVGGEGWQGVPDPGAHGLAEFLMGLSEGLR